MAVRICFSASANAALSRVSRSGKSTSSTSAPASSRFAGTTSLPLCEGSDIAAIEDALAAGQVLRLDARPSAAPTKGSPAAEVTKAMIDGAMQAGGLLVDLPERETRLKDALAEALSQMKSAIVEVAPEYDFILLDCPPSLSLLTLNGLCAADAVLIPMQCEYYALEGLSDLVQTVKKVRAHLNPALEIEGLLRTMYDPRNTLALNVGAELEKHFGDKLYRTVIPRNIRLAEAPSHGIAALHLDKNSKGALAYLALAGEMLRRMEAATAPQASAEPAAPAV